MYAIVEIAGLQYKVEKDQHLYVNRLAGEQNDVVKFDKVLLTDNGSVVVGAPVIEGALVEAKILEHLRGDKVVIFKKKRRKGYDKKTGFRHALTKIQILSIGAGSGKSVVTEKKATTKKAVAAKATASASKAEPKAAKAEPKAAKETPAKATAEPAAKAEKKVEKINIEDLTLIEGIGPKVQEIFNNNDIFTYAQLAKTSENDLRAILEAEGGVYAAMDPATWAKQASLAAEGKLEELKAWQAELDGGSKPAAIQVDDLTIIEGIGPKVQELLNNNDIYSFVQLSKATDLVSILEAEGGVYAAMDPATWPKQAELAADGKFDELKAWQDELNGGKED